MRPLYALHKDRAGQILGASNFINDYDLRLWIGKLDLRDGDTIAFGEVFDRADFEEVEPIKPAFIDQPEAPGTPDTEKMLEDEQPF